MLLDPFSDFGQVLVLLADVVLLAQVDQEDNGLSRQKEERVDDLDLLITLALIPLARLIIARQRKCVLSDINFILNMTRNVRFLF